MGAWGHKSLENDTACDWLWELKENSTKKFIENTLDEVLTITEYLDSDYSSCAIAAIEVIAFIKGNSDEDAEEFEEVDTDSIAKEVDNDLIKKAQNTIDRILTQKDNELYELWEETELFGVWKESVASLKTKII